MYVCPNCGYCPHCGRGGYVRPRPIPYRPFPYYVEPFGSASAAVSYARAALSGG